MKEPDKRIHVYTTTTCIKCHKLMELDKHNLFKFRNLDNIEREEERVILQWAEHNGVKSVPFGIAFTGEVYEFETLMTKLID